MTNSESAAVIRIRDLQAALGGFVQQWNVSELMIRDVLSIAAGNGPAVRILTAHMSNAHLSTALEELVQQDLVDTRAAPALRHAVAFYRLLAPHRNYLVHEPLPTFGVGESHEEALGFSRSNHPRNGRPRFGCITKSQLVEAKAWAKALSDHLSNIIHRLYAGATTKDGTITSPDIPDWEFPPLPRKFEHPHLASARG